MFIIPRNTFCFYHNDGKAKAYCSRCSKPICQEDIHKVNLKAYITNTYCPICYSKYLDEKPKWILLYMVIISFLCGMLLAKFYSDTSHFIILLFMVIFINAILLYSYIKFIRRSKISHKEVEDLQRSLSN